MYRAVGALVGFVGSILMLYGLFELNKFIGAGLLLFAASQAAMHAFSQKD